MMKTPLKIGVAGFSRNQFDQLAARKHLRDFFQHLREKHGGRPIEVVSDYRVQGVPLIACELAKEFGMVTVGFSARQALRVRAGVYHCDKEFIVRECLGDESQAFVAYYDGLIRIGGGAQSRREVEMFAALHPASELNPRLQEVGIDWYGK